MSYSIAQTVSEEDQENCMTEEEASIMIREFNSHLKDLSIQIAEVTKSNTNLLQKVEKEAVRNESLRQTIAENKTLLENLAKEGDAKSQHLNQLEMRMHSEAFKILPGTLEDLDQVKAIIEEERAKEMISYLGQLESYSIILKTQKKLIEKKLEDKYKQINTETKCVSCKRSYVPAKNHNRACAYHPGNLRYFSCRGCGGDPYYDCCLKCKNCSEGCKISHHTS